MNYNEELYELENFEGFGFSNFLKDQSKKFIKKTGTKIIEKAVNTGGEKIGELIANKIISLSKNNNISNEKLYEDTKSKEIPIDSGYKIIKILQRNPVDNISTQYNSI